jgi:hypothetical protein
MSDIDAIQNLQLQQTLMFQTLSKAAEDSLKKISDTSGSATKSVVEALGKMEKSVEEVSNKIAAHLSGITSKTGGAVKAGAEHVEEHTKKIKKHGDEVGKVKKHYEELGKQISAFMPSNLAPELTKTLVEGLPEISGWTLAIKTLMDFSSQTSGMFRSSAGDTAGLSQFAQLTEKVSQSTNLASEKVIELGEAFEKQGIELGATTPDLEAYMKVSAQAVNYLGLSANTSAEFTKNMMMSGKSAGDVSKSYDVMFRQMQTSGLQIDDMAAAINDANNIFDQFGADSGKSVDQLAVSLEKTRALFKGIGLDAKDAASAISKELSNVNGRMQEASIIAVTLGKSTEDVFKDLPSSEGQLEKMQAFLKLADQRTGGLINMDPSKLNMSQTAMKQGVIGDLAKQLNLDPNQAQKLAGEFTNQKMQNSNLTQADFFRSKQEEGGKTKSWDEANAKYNASISQLAPKLEHTMTNLALIIGGPLMTVLDPLVSILNVFLDMVADLVQLEPVKWLIGITTAGIALVSAFTALSAGATFIGGLFAESALVTGLTSFIGWATALVQVSTWAGSFSGALAFIAGELIPILSTFVGGLVATLNPLTLIVGGLVLAAMTIYHFKDQIASFGKSMLEGIGGLFKNFHPSGNMMAAGMLGGPTGMLLMMNPLIDTFFTKLERFFADFFPNLLKNLPKYLTGAGEAVGGALGATGHLASGAVGSGVAALSDAFKGLMSDGSNGNKFGWLSSKHEASSPGTIGDYMFKGRHNVAYGNWQMDAGMGTPQNFSKWLQKRGGGDAQVGSFLGAASGSAMQGAHGEFGRRWQLEANEHGDQFKDLQREFAKQMYLAPMLNKFGDILKSPTMQEVAFSTAVQHGTGGAEDVFNKAGAHNHLSDADLIKNVYLQRNASTGGSMHSRYSKESEEAVQALLAEQNTLLKNIAGNQQVAMTKDDQHKAKMKKIAMSGTNQTAANQARNQMNQLLT